jgi:hypothetical protein
MPGSKKKKGGKAHKQKMANRKGKVEERSHDGDLLKKMKLMYFCVRNSMLIMGEKAGNPFSDMLHNEAPGSWGASFTWSKELGAVLHYRTKNKHFDQTQHGEERAREARDWMLLLEDSRLNQEESKLGKLMHDLSWIVSSTCAGSVSRREARRDRGRIASNSGAAGEASEQTTVVAKNEPGTVYLTNHPFIARCRQKEHTGSKTKVEMDEQLAENFPSGFGFAEAANVYWLVFFTLLQTLQQSTSEMEKIGSEAEVESALGKSEQRKAAFDQLNGKFQAFKTVAMQPEALRRQYLAALPELFEAVWCQSSTDEVVASSAALQQALIKSGTEIGEGVEQTIVNRVKLHMAEQFIGIFQQQAVSFGFEIDGDPVAERRKYEEKAKLMRMAEKLAGREGEADAERARQVAQMTAGGSGVSTSAPPKVAKAAQELQKLALGGQEPQKLLGGALPGSTGAHSK